MKHGPYTATPRQVSIHYTMGGVGGVTIDSDAHVLDKEGRIIPGLYAAGEITGGIHGSNRLGGNAITDIIVFGLQAAKSMVKDTIG
ncbi:FAD-binding protein [Oscillospiraceae bacterium Marseille-Q3528]|nr:FAD-binding protein [Oscillospiraceae bacterium Marseille-Q3528]